MSDELVKRLRARAKRENDYYEHGGDIINEAADAIEALQKNVAYWQAQLTKSMCGETLAELEKPRWVSVADGLPSPMKAVLVWTPYKHNIFMAYLQGNKWYIWGPDDSCCHNWPEYHAITHWMELPKPPKEET